MDRILTRADIMRDRLLLHAFSVQPVATTPWSVTPVPSVNQADSEREADEDSSDASSTPESFHSADGTRDVTPNDPSDLHSIASISSSSSLEAGGPDPTRDLPTDYGVEGYTIPPAQEDSLHYETDTIASSGALNHKKIHAFAL